MVVASLLTTWLSFTFKFSNQRFQEDFFFFIMIYNNSNKVVRWRMNVANFIFQKLILAKYVLKAENLVILSLLTERLRKLSCKITHFQTI